MAKIQRLKKKRRQEEQLQERIESQTSMQTHMILYKISTEMIEKIELLSGTWILITFTEYLLLLYHKASFVLLTLEKFS